MKLAYLLKKFPRLSETFVLGEMLAQERLGAELHVFSRRAPDPEPEHPELAELRAAVEVLPPTREIDPWRALFDGGAADDGLLESLRAALADLAEIELPRLPALVAEALHLRRRCAELGVAHVHVHFATEAAVTAMLLHALGGPTYSITAHAKDIYRSTVRPELLRRVIGRSAFTVTVCDANVRHMASLLGPEAAARVRRLYNGIDRASFAEAGRANGGAAREPGHVLSVGRLVEKKGFDVLVEALALLARRGAPVRATLVGDGDERERLAALAHERGLSGRVEFTGALDQGRVRELMRRCEVFCLPCVVGADGNRDALPTVLLEAQAAGLPIVSTPVTGIPEILDDGRAGLLVPEHDAAATAAAIERLCADGELRARLARAGRVRAEQLFDRAGNAEVLHAWFADALARREDACTSST